MKTKQQFFLYVVFKQQKFLFILLIAFIIGQSFFSYKQVETFPFFNYGMYSSSVANQDTFTIPVIMVNKEPLNIYQHYDLGISFVVYNLYYYYHFRQQQYKDPTLRTIEQRFANKVSPNRLKYFKKMLTNNQKSADQFIQWLYQYLNQSWKTPIQQLECYEQSYVYTPEGFQLLGRQKLIQATIPTQ